jgi:large subunit ribosomal protein LP2
MPMLRSSTRFVSCVLRQSLIRQVITELSGKDIAAVIAEGNKKLASVPSGAAPAAAPAAATTGAAPAAAPKAEEKKAPKKKTTSEDGDMGFGLFD